MNETIHTCDGLVQEAVSKELPIVLTFISLVLFAAEAVVNCSSESFARFKQWVTVSDSGWGACSY